MSTFFTILGLILALVVGFFVGRWHGMSNRSKQLAEDLEKKEQELSELKSHVSEHFDETARLFGNLTEEYKAFYQHLAKSADKMGNQNFQLGLASNATLSSLQFDAKTTEAADISNTNGGANIQSEVKATVTDIEVKPPLDYASEPENSVDDGDQSEHAEHSAQAPQHSDNPKH